MFEKAFLDSLRLPPPVFSPEELSTLRRFALASGIRPEGSREFSLERRRYLDPLYGEERGRFYHRLVVRKAAQLGLTLHFIYRAAWLTADTRQQINVALMFPTQDAVYELHKTRFRPMMHSSPRMLELVGTGGVDSMEAVRFGVSNMRFRGMRSGVSVDSFPTDALQFDEVRLMDVATIERTFLRTSESAFVGPRGERGMHMMGSTAGMPNADVDYYFQRSTQHWWHTRCPNPLCPNRAGFVMYDSLETWLSCVDAARMEYVCPRCGHLIHDVQDGFFHAVGPEDAEWLGYSFSQVLKGAGDLPNLWGAYQRMVVEGKNPSEFYNSYLGLPHADPDAILVGDTVWQAALELGAMHGWAWPPEGPSPDSPWRAAGIDQRGVEKHVVILEWAPGGLVRLVRLEVLEASGLEAVARTTDLLRRWAVNVVVCDAEPAYDYAKAVASEMPRGMVWLADYNLTQDQPIEWADQREKKSLERSSGEAKWEFLVDLHRYRHLLQAMTLFTNRRVLLPKDGYTLVRELRRGGRLKPVALLEEMREHFKHVARTQIPKTRRIQGSGEVVDEGEYQYTFRHLGLDPHFVHAFGYAVAGLMRVRGSTQLAYAKPQPERPYSGYQDQLPEVIRPSALAEARPRRQCRGCAYFKPPGEGEALGWCENAAVALSLGAHPPVRTAPATTNCARWKARP
ncbi:phage terminase large subunit family protein [Calidithermus chliarophilus]|uniref:phage terminase large subunit family protein n=1 Tax=Calidithermus chliarophilus TaxID=52023 RepID=UPI0003FDA964|nr:phage terminase large subunit family protein [Calidithermus chliarophilus]